MSLLAEPLCNACSVRFDPTIEKLTQVKVAMEFEPAKALGTVIAELLGQS